MVCKRKQALPSLVFVSLGGRMIQNVNANKFVKKKSSGKSFLVFEQLLLLCECE